MKIQQILTKGYEILKESNIESYVIDCQLLLSQVLKLDRLSIITNRDMDIDNDKVNEFFKLINLRKDKMPVKYILGKTEFMGLNFIIKPGVLIPRPDTEVLVEETLRIIKENQFSKVCDVCCGSGAIGLSIASLDKGSDVECYDISEVACEVTSSNIELLGIRERARVFHSDLLEQAIENKKSFQLIVSNPPYIKEKVIPTLMDDVKNYEPYIALSGGIDGLDFYRKITEQSIKVLNRGGVLAFEIGYDQREDVSSILKSNGFLNIRALTDLAGNDRVVIGVLP